MAVTVLESSASISRPQCPCQLTLSAAWHILLRPYCNLPQLCALKAITNHDCKANDVPDRIPCSMQVANAPKLTRLSIDNSYSRKPMEHFPYFAPALQSLDLVAWETLPPCSDILTADLTSLVLRRLSDTSNYKDSFYDLAMSRDRAEPPELPCTILKQCSPKLEHVQIVGYACGTPILHKFRDMSR